MYIESILFFVYSFLFLCVINRQSELRAKRIERVGEIKNRKRVLCDIKTDRVYCEQKELRELERIKTEREFLCVLKTDKVIG